MAEDRNARFWKRVLIAFLVSVGSFFALVVYFLIRVGEEFKLAIKD